MIFQNCSAIYSKSFTFRDKVHKGFTCEIYYLMYRELGLAKWWDLLPSTKSAVQYTYKMSFQTFYLHITKGLPDRKFRKNPNQMVLLKSSS